MFNSWFYGNEFTTLQTRVRELEAGIKRRDEADKKHLEKIREQLENSEVSVDWQRMGIVSIERVLNQENRLITVLGFLKPDNTAGEKFGEWNLFCNDETHRRLVAEFNQYRSKI